MVSVTACSGLAWTAAAVGLAALLLHAPQVLAGQPRTSTEADPLQIVADVVLIESQCRALNVDYGKLFAFAERNGIRPAEILPTGDRRAAFDAAYRRRAREAHGDQLCGELAAARNGIIPGVFTAR